MDDDLTTLQDVLRDRAAEVPHLQQAPPKMLVRARRRVVRNALSSAVAAGLVVVAASTGLAGLRASSSGPGGGGPVPSPATPACLAADLRVTANLQGAAGSLVGSIDLKNHADLTCTLEGRPTITVRDAFGRELSPVVGDVDPQWLVDGASPPGGWPTVTLRSFEVVAIRVKWTNQCPQLLHPASWTIDLGGGNGTLDVTVSDPPSCLGSAEPSTLDVGPFEPGGGGS